MPVFDGKKINRSLRVFLCHSKGDKPVIRALYQRLRAQGIEPWLDEEDILPGQDWEIEIHNAVRSSDIVLACLSIRSVTKAGYVQKEIKIALDAAERQPDGAIFLIPLRLEECEVPERLKKWQWVNLFDDGGFDKLMRSLQTRRTQLEQTLVSIPRASESAEKWGKLPTALDLLDKQSLIDSKLSRWVAGDTEAREDALALLYPQIRKSAITLVRSAVYSVNIDADELAQETMIRLLRIDKLRWEKEKGEFAAYLHGIMRRILIDQLRREKRSRGQFVKLSPKELTDIAEVKNEVRDMDNAIDIDRILRIVESYGPEARQIFELLFVGGMNYQDIAKAIGISEDTIRKRVHKIISALRSKI